MFTNDNVDTQVHIFNEVFHKCLDSCAPLVTKEVRRPFVPWITEDLKPLMQQSDCALKNLIEDRNNINLQTSYKNLKKANQRIVSPT